MILAGTPLPGGELIAGQGGYLYVCQGAVDPLTASQSISKRLDVSQWVGQGIYRDVECTHSGSAGAIHRRRVALDYQINLEICYDVSNPPEYLLGNSATVGFQLFIGDPAVYTNASVVKRYVSPSAFLTVGQTIVPSKGTDIVRYICSLKGNSLMFLLPEGLALYQAYLVSLRNKGWMT